MNRIVLGDNMDVLPTIEDGAAALIYIDPPFNTGKAQRRERLRTVRDDEHGDRTGFQGKRYRTVRLGAQSFDDMFDDFLAFLEPRLEEAHRILSPTGSFFLHIDYREAHYCKVLLDALFGRDCFMNEIIWAYDYGGRPKDRWPAKHDTLLWYVKDPAWYTFHHDAIDRVPYMAPGLAGAEKAARGKVPDRRVVADHRADGRARAYGLPDAEAHRHPQPHRAGALQPRRSGAGLLRGVRDDGRGCSAQRQALLPHRQQPGGGAHHGGAPRVQRTGGEVQRRRIGQDWGKRNALPVQAM